MKRDRNIMLPADKASWSAANLLLDSPSSKQKQLKTAMSAPPASPQVWSRYIDSRLKQFGSR